MPPNDTLAGASKADLQKVIAIVFLGIFGAGIIYFFVAAKLDITIDGSLDVNIFIGPFIGIIIGIFTWLGFKTGQGS